jgi:hypothetical protein
LPALILWQGHVVGHLDHQRRDALAEFFRELLAVGPGVLDGVVQPAGGDKLGIRTIGRGGKQVRNLGEVIDIGLVAAALALHAGVAARGALGSFGDKANSRQHGVTARLLSQALGSLRSLPPCGGGAGRGVPLAPTFDG